MFSVRLGEFFPSLSLRDLGPRRSCSATLEYSLRLRAQASPCSPAHGTSHARTHTHTLHRSHNHNHPPSSPARARERARGTAPTKYFILHSAFAPKLTLSCSLSSPSQPPSSSKDALVRIIILPQHEQPARRRLERVVARAAAAAAAAQPNNRALPAPLYWQPIRLQRRTRRARPVHDRRARGRMRRPRAHGRGTAVYTTAKAQRLG